MGSSAVKRRINRKNSESASHDQKSRHPDALDASLKAILDSLAGLLVTTGYGYTRLAKLAKLSFVEAARSIDRENERKVSNARIAALTGLTRTDVSQLLRKGNEYSADAAEPANRALRVVRGWLADARYATPSGEPRRLQFKGSGPSFSSLVKKYSGDIPARAMLSEMKRLRMVSHDNNDGVVLVREKIGISRATTLTVRAISPWVEMLAAGNGSPIGEVTSKSKQVQLNFSSSSQLLAAARELEHRRLAFVNGMEQLGEASEGNRKYFLRVSIAVAAESSTRKTKKRRGKRAETK